MNTKNTISHILVLMQLLILYFSSYFSSRCTSRSSSIHARLLTYLFSTLKRNQLESVPVFIGLNALKQLNLANNRIQRISSEALEALPKLKTLDLSRNFLHALESSYFPFSNRLAHL